MISAVLLTAVAIAAVAGGCGDGDGDGEPPGGDNEPVVEEPIPKFAYEGADGPSNWSRLDPEWSPCGEGLEQSPIDLSGAEEGSVASLNFAYSASSAIVANTGHAIEVALADAGSVTVGSTTYDLEQFHFHSPSEHRIADRRFPAEMHLVHTSGERPPVVIGVLIEEGDENPTLKAALADVPPEPADERPLDSEVDPSELLPGGGFGAVYRYRGSLTTPPCTEGVLWTVYERPLELSAEQIEALTTVYPSNARPLQPLGERRLTRGPLR
jgi:carbonic anhydrase